VRVSSLKDAKSNSAQLAEVLQQQEAGPVLVESQNKINRFFKVKSKSELTEDSNEDYEMFKSLESVLHNCPHCCSLIEGNEDFVLQHLDMCMRLV